MSQYTHLHLHSHYSIRDAITHVPDIVSRVKELGMNACSLNDHGTAAGLTHFYNECKRNDIKPILGQEFYLAPRGRFEKDKDLDRGYYHINLIAMNNIGYKNILALTTESYYKESFYVKPRIDKDLLRQHSEGILCLSACLASEVQRSILKGISFSYDGEDKTKLVSTDFEKTIMWYKEVFGDRFYLEIMRHGIPAEEAAEQIILENYKKWDIKILATTDSHYLLPEDRKLHDIMFAIRDRGTIKDPGRYTFNGDGYHITSPQEMIEKFADIPDAISNTMEVAARCNVDLSENFSLDKFPSIVDPFQEDNILKEYAETGLKNRMGTVSKEYNQRLHDELDTISRMGFSSYFLMVGDMTQWARNQKIAVGPGRGSAAGSLLSYAVGITDVDPILYDLSFARFLNKGRAAVPNITFEEFAYENFVKATCDCQGDCTHG